MTWVDPVTLSALFDTDDIPTQGNFDSLFNNSLSQAHILETPTTADLDINTDATERTLYSVTVLANTMTSTGLVLQELDGDYLYNQSTGHGLQFKVKFGGTTILDTGSVTGINTLSASRFPWMWVVKCANRGATNAQLISSFFTYSRSSGTTGLGQLIVPGGGISGVMQNTAAIDTTVDQTLAITIQWSNAFANNSFRRRWARTLIGQN